MNTKKFAQLCGVEKRTLFYYDELGLLKPAAVRENGYREYAPKQFSEMDMIKLLQASGYTLKEIGDILGADTEARRTHFFAARALIDDKIAALCEMKEYISQKELLLHEYQDFLQSGKEYIIAPVSMTYTEKTITEDSHFFSFLSDGGFDSAILDDSNNISAYREELHGRKREGRAISFFLKIPVEAQMLDAIREKLAPVPFACEGRYYVSVLPTLLTETEGHVVIKVISFEKSESLPARQANDGP